MTSIPFFMTENSESHRYLTEEEVYYFYTYLLQYK